MYDDKEIKARHAKFHAIRDAFAAKLTAALTDAGLTVKSNLTSKEWTPCGLTITSEQAKYMEHQVRFMVFPNNNYGGPYPSRLRLTYIEANVGAREYRVHYKVLNDALITKLVDFAKEGLKNEILREANKRAEAGLKAHYASIKKESLAGVVIPPGTRVNIIASTDSDFAGKYYVSFEPGHGAVTDFPLSVEQIKKLMAVLCDLQGADTGYIITGISQLVNTPVVYTNYGFSDSDPKIYPSKEAAEADIPCIRRNYNNKNPLCVVPYVDYARI